MKLKLKNFYLITISTLILGLIMILFPQFVQTAFNYILGCIMLFISFYLSIPYLKGNDFSNWSLLIPASIVGSLGLFFILCPGLLTRILWLFIGGILLFDSLSKFLTATKMKESNIGAYNVNIICSAFTFVIALLLIFTPFAERIMIIISGGFLIANTICDLVAYVNLARFKKTKKKSNTNSKIVSEQNFDK